MENSSHLLEVGDFVLNTDSRKLFDSHNKEVSLPPTLFTLLKFFIDNQNKVLSKDMIIANVWRGKIVVEANVNQNIKKLRDVLGDSASAPRYIETVTGKGFRFIANSQEYKSAPDDTRKGSRKIKYSAFFSLVIVIVISVYLSKEDDESSVVKELHPLTTLKGLEYYPNVSSDKKYLIFNHKKAKGSWDIYVKPLNKESYKPIVSSPVDEYFPVISEDQTKLIYSIVGKESCGLYIRDVNLEKASVGKSKKIKSCQSSQERYRAEWINDSEIFIAVNEDPVSPANIYHYNIDNQNQTLISKPDSRGFGDYALKYSPSEKKLAYIRNIGWSSSEIWVYDLMEKAHRKIKSTPLNLAELDWYGDWIIFQSGNKEISRISSNGAKEEVLANFLSNVYMPFVITDKQIGVVMGNFRIVDVSQFDIDLKQKSTVINSSFNDYLAAGGGDLVAFVSNRTGKPQVWIQNKQGIATPLTQFEDSYEIKWLSVSPDGNLIMFNKSGKTNIFSREGELIFDSENYSTQIHNNAVFDVTNDRFIYSVQYGGEWNIEFRKLGSLGERTVLIKGITARPCLIKDCIYYFKEKDSYIYRYSPQSNTSEKIISIDFLTRADEWDIYDENHIIYIEKGDSDNLIVKLNLTTGAKETILILESKAKAFSFERQKNLIYTNVVSEGNTDMMHFIRK